MPKGGARPGAGRKPGSKNRATVLGLDGVRHPYERRPIVLPPALDETERADLLVPPVELSPGAAEVWRRWAPLALEERTLTRATVAGFRELCRRQAIVDDLEETIGRLGAGTSEAIKYLRERRGQAAQLGNALKDFKLSAFGKPATSDKPKPAANPWAGIAGTVAAG